MQHITISKEPRHSGAPNLAALPRNRPADAPLEVFLRELAATNGYSAFANLII
jgi:hypothetical protein